MRQADVPGRVAADRLAGKEHAIGVDREPPAGVAQRIEHGGVFAGRIAILFWCSSVHAGRDDDVAVAGGLANAPPPPPHSAGPPVDLLVGRGDAGRG